MRLSSSSLAISSWTPSPPRRCAGAISLRLVWRRRSHVEAHGLGHRHQGEEKNVDKTLMHKTQMSKCVAMSAHGICGQMIFRSSNSRAIFISSWPSPCSTTRIVVTVLGHEGLRFGGAKLFAPICQAQFGTHSACHLVPVLNLPLFCLVKF